MEPRQIRAMLNYPDAALVIHAVDRANLTADERRVLRMREHDSYTVERAAETLECSDMTVKNRYRSAMDKLDRCWSALPWVDTIIKQ